VVDGVTRANLAERTLRVLNRGRARNPDVFLVRGDGGPVVVKDFAPRGRLVRALLGPWLQRRELRAYRALAGHPAVPRLLGELDALAFALEYRPGQRVSRRLRGRVPPDFVAALDAAVGEMHRRGVAHLDLRHRSNVLAGEDGRPVLIDFASALCLRPGGLAARLLLPLAAGFDRRALAKWRARLLPQPAEGAGAAGASGSGRGASRPT
jgi:predicted Ser/Thr protein kinase